VQSARLADSKRIVASVSIFCATKGRRTISGPYFSLGGGTVSIKHVLPTADFETLREKKN